MKKIMWIISFAALAGTAAVLGILPDSVPMHYGFAGNIDRWGSKYESLIFPVLILLFSLFWTLLAGYYERKAIRTADEKESAGLKSNAKVLSITGVCMAAMYTVMQGFSLYKSYRLASSQEVPQAFDFVRLTAILLGLLFIVLGNIMPKTRNNSIVGARTRWSMYNDNTWRKSNRFGAAALIIAGAMTILTAVFMKNSIGAALMAAVYAVIGAAASAVYSYGAYKQELALEGRRKD